MTTPSPSSSYVLPSFKDIKVSEINGKPLPIVLSPISDEAKSKKYLVNFCTVNREALMELMFQKKVVLFRGFDLPSAQVCHNTIRRTWI
jgi:hypothetical protein